MSVEKPVRLKGYEVVGYLQQDFFTIVKAIKIANDSLGKSEEEQAQFSLKVLRLWSEVSRGEMSKNSLLIKLGITQEEIDKKAQQLNIDIAAKKANA
jgi:hypothetical protein